MAAIVCHTGPYLIDETCQVWQTLWQAKGLQGDAVAIVLFPDCGYLEQVAWLQEQKDLCNCDVTIMKAEWDSFLTDWKANNPNCLSKKQRCRHPPSP